jgi:uncharacterized ion transporter superfamily protein YfcC
MKKLRFPDSLVLIFGMILLAQLLAYVVPAGEYERETNDKGRALVVPNTYQTLTDKRAEALANGTSEAEAPALPKIPASTFLTAIPRGLEKGADIIFFVFLVGGVIGVIRATGAIDALIGTALRTFGGQPLWLVAGMVTLFAIGSSTIGMAEEYMPFIPILVTMCLAIKMDAIVAVAIVYVGAGVGYGCAVLNPFTVMIAQDIAGLEPASGQLFRWVLLAICIAVGVHHIMRYAKTIANDPSRSLVRDVDYSKGFEMPEDLRLTPARIAILAVFAIAIVVFVYGVKVHGWYLVELAAIFLALGISAALIARLSPNRTSSEFTKGAAELTTTALLIGFARAIQVVLDDARVTDTVIHALAQPLKQTGPEIASLGMLAVQSICNFFIPSGSGQAYVTMPIMAPLGEVTGVPAQVTVLAYQFGDGFTNMIVPTNALLMGMLALGKIPYQQWLRFLLPLLIKLYIIAAIALVIAVKAFG